jgi:hypothetical protein
MVGSSYLIFTRCRLRYNRTDTTHEIPLRSISRERVIGVCAGLWNFSKIRLND